MSDILDNLPLIGVCPEGAIVLLDQEPEDDFAEDFRPDPREAEREFYTRLKSGVMPMRHHRKYMSQGGGCADHLDQTLRDLFTDPVDGVDRKALEATGRQNGVWNDRWSSLNNGMVRMNLANRLRALARRGKDIELMNASGTCVERGRFGIAPTALQKEESEREEAAARKAEAAEKAAVAAKHREERDAILEARQASTKPPKARIEQKLTAKRAKTPAKSKKAVATA